MLVRFSDKTLERLECEAGFSGKYAAEAVTAFRKRMQQLRAAVDERDLRGLKSLHFEELKGDRRGENSIRLNKQWRLVFKIEGTPPQKVLNLLSIEDYH